MSDSYPVSTMGSQWNKNHIQLMNFYTTDYGQLGMAFFIPVTAHLKTNNPVPSIVPWENFSANHSTTVGPPKEQSR